jgi:hypothetical protein
MAKAPTARCSARSATAELAEKALTPNAVYELVREYSAQLGFEIGAHALRATAATTIAARCGPPGAES